MEKNWLVYILRCKDDTLYTGATNNIERRLKAHNNGKYGAKYTRIRRPCELIAKTGFMSQRDALKFERKVKRQAKKDKVDFLISSSPIS